MPGFLALALILSCMLRIHTASSAFAAVVLIHSCMLFEALSLPNLGHPDPGLRPRPNPGLLRHLKMFSWHLLVAPRLQKASSGLNFPAKFSSRAQVLARATSVENVFTQRKVERILL